jgi:hypothetical protein
LRKRFASYPRSQFFGPYPTSQTVAERALGAPKGSAPTGGRPINDPSDLQNLFVKTADGSFITLSSLVTIKEVAIAPTLGREDRQRAVGITANLNDGVVLGDAVEAMRGLPHAPAARHDDHGRRGARCRPADLRQRRWRRGAPAARLDHRWRSWSRNALHVVPDAGDVSDPGAAFETARPKRSG